MGKNLHNLRDQLRDFRLALGRLDLTLIKVSRKLDKDEFSIDEADEEIWEEVAIELASSAIMIRYTIDKNIERRETDGSH